MEQKSNRPLPPACEAVRARAIDAIVADPAGVPPPEADGHLEACPECRAEIEAWVRLDGEVASALGDIRRRIRGLAPEDIDRIIAAVRETPPTAVLLGRIRRSVRRMVLLTLLVLSFLAVAGIAWALVLLWKAQG